MKILKIILIIAPILQTINYEEGVKEIIYMINISDEK